MAGKDNLISFRGMSAGRQREIATMRGKASQAAAKRRKSLKEKAQLILSLPVNDTKNQTQMKKMGLDIEDIDNATLMLMGLFRRAVLGDVPAFKEMRDLAEGDKNNDVIQKIDEMILKIENYIE